MEIKGKVHCLFEQSGTFKNEFKKMGYSAFDYDIQNNFGETDFTIDLFRHIKSAYDGGWSVFDEMNGDDLILAFFPCIYFCEASQSYFMLSNNNYRKLTDGEKIERILERSEKRTEYFNLLVKLVAVCLRKGFRIIIENPWTMPHFLSAAFLKSPSVVDKDRTLRGDFFRKPTAYWFFNCEPTSGFTWRRDKDVQTVWGKRGSGKAGVCSEERSMISPDYARNFIRDFVLGEADGDSLL